MSYIIQSDQIPTFNKGIRVGTNNLESTTNESDYGTIRYKDNRLECLFKTAGSGIGGSDLSDVNAVWRTLASNVASTSEAGVIKVGTNLLMNPTTGILTATTTGESRIYQGVISISDNPSSADYQTINSAISNALGSPPNYNDGSITTTNGAPSLTNKYILLVGPGIYNERIHIPDNVILRGEGPNKTFIKMDTGGSSILNGSLITLGNDSSLEDLSIEINGNSQEYAVGVYTVGNSNVSINNVEILDSTGITTTASYGIYISDNSGHSIKNTKTELDLGNGSLYGIYLSNTSLDYYNNKTILSGTATNNYGLYINDITGGLNYIVNSDIEINGATNNYGIYHNNADSTIKYCRVDVNGDLYTSTDTAFGIAGNSTSTSASITSSSIELIQNVKNIIYLSDISITDFVSAGFKIGMVINISGASNPINNNYFTIDRITPSEITLSESDILIAESAGSPITIKQLYTVNIDYSTIKAINNASSISNSIAILSSNGNYAMDLTTSQIYGGIPRFNTSKIILSEPNIITVAKKGGDFYLLSQAINSIVDNNSTRRYIIKIKPGSYLESSQIICKQYVSIEGSGSENTTITFNIASGTLSEASMLVLESNIDISGIRFVNTTTSLTSTSIGIYGSSKSDINIRNCEISITGTAQTKYGIYTNNCIYQMNDNDISVVAGDSSSSNYGVYNTSSTHTSDRDKITVSGLSSTLNVAVSCLDTTLDLLEPKISVSGSTNMNKGVSVSSSGSQDYLARINQGEVITSGTGNNSLVIEDDNYTLIAVGTRLGGDVSFTDSNTDTTLKCIGCYQVSGTTSLTYSAISQHGTTEGTSESLILGDGAGNADMTGTKNTLLGFNAGNALSSGNRNTFVGSNAGKIATITDDNTFIGSDAGINASTGDFNTLVGSNAGGYLTNAIQNVIVGRNAGRSLTTGNYNTFLGEAAGYNAINAEDNVMVGQGSGFSTTTGSRNVFVGGSSSSNVGAGYGNVDGEDNVAIGYQSLKTNIGSNDNVSIGKKAGYSTTAADNTFVGSDSGYYLSTGTENVMIGRMAGYGDSGGATGSGNTIVGSNAGISMTSGGSNLILGYRAGNSLTEGSRNILMGPASSLGSTDAAGYTITTGTDSIMIGSKSGKSITTSSHNICIGSNTGSSMSTGSSVILIGTDAGASITTGIDNLFIGRQAGYSYNGGSALMIGNYAGQYSASNASTYIGVYSGQNMKGVHNTFIGYQAGMAFNASGYGTHNVAIGPYVAKKIDAGSRNIVIGSGDLDIGESAAAQLNDGDDNIIMGYKTGKNIQDGSGHILIGTEAGQSLVNNNNSIAIGYQSGYKMTGGNNLMIGYQSGYNQTTPEKNIVLGYQAAYLNKTGNNIIAIGSQAGYTSNSNLKNISIGTEAGYYSIGDNNINIGYQAGKAASTGVNNTFLGYLSGGYGTDGTNITGSYNLCLGSETGYSMREASRNVLIGYKVGYDIAGGSKNVLIGNYSGYQSTASKNIFIGITDSDTHGIGHNTTGPENIAIGSNVACNNTTGERNIFIGREAGEDNTTASHGIAIGYRAGKDNTIGEDNISIGSQAGRYNISGEQNINIGYKAGFSDSSAGKTFNYNISIGREAGTSLQNDKLICIGYRAGMVSTTGIDNIFVGSNSGVANTTGSHNIYIGADSGKVAVSANQNVVIGDNAGSSLLGSDNIIMGFKAGEEITTGINNVIIGSNAMKDGDASNCISIGANAGQSNTTDGNMFIGVSAGENNITGIDNIFIGKEAGFSNIVGLTNIFIGNSAGYSNTTGNENIFIGESAGFSCVDGERNILLGALSGRGLSSGSDNILMGKNAGKECSDGEKNVCIAFDAGHLLSSGDNNILIGVEAGYSTGNASSVIAIGFQSGYNNTTSNNIFFGVNSGFKHVIDDDNIFIGDSAGYGNSSHDYFGSKVESFHGNQNIALGNNSGYNITTGFRNVFIGSNVGNTVTSGSDNLLIGNDAGSSLTTESNNLCLGVNAGKNNLSSNNMFIGTDAGRDTNTGTRNVCMGFSAGVLHQTHSDNIFIGTNAGFGDSSYGSYNIDAPDIFSGNINIAIGSSAGYNLTVGYSNTFIGNSSGYSTTSGENNMCIGSIAGYSITTGSNNLLMGNEAGYNITTESNNLCLGASAGYKNTGPNNMFIGTNAGKNNTTGSNNMFIGNSSGFLNTIGYSNVYMGNTAGYYSTEGYQNICIGDIAGHNITTGFNNLLMGNQSGYNITTQTDNVCIGNQAGYNTTTNDNIFIGSSSGKNNTTGSANLYLGKNAGLNATDGSDNIAIGQDAGSNIISSDNNIFIGYQSGNTLTTGTDNVIIGYDADVSGVSGTNQIVIGSGAIGPADNTVVIGNSSITDIYMASDASAKVRCGSLLAQTSTNSADIIKLHADAGTSQTINILNDEGTSNSAIALTSSAGGITLSSKNLFYNTDTINVGIGGDITSLTADGTVRDPNASTVLLKSIGGVFSETNILNASDGVAGDNFGFSVSISETGNDAVAIIGAYGDDDNGDSSGSAYIFDKSSGSWAQIAKLDASDGAAYDYFGSAVSISGTGNNAVAIIGAYVDESARGAAYIFDKSSGSWAQIAKLVASDGAINDQFGISVSISGTGNDAVAIIGAFGDDSNIGSAYIFDKSSGSWAQIAKLVSIDGATNEFGMSVSITGTGNNAVAIIGASKDDSDKGAAYIFDKSSGSWAQIAKLVASDGVGGFFGDRFGNSVSISGTGNDAVAIIGANGDDSSKGSSYIFDKSGGSWTEIAKLVASDGAIDDRFGSSVSISGTGNDAVAIIGASSDDSNKGSSYIFNKSSGSWTQIDKLVASDGAGSDLFGSSVSISGNSNNSLSIIGAYGNDSSKGSSYIFSQENVVYHWDLTGFGDNGQLLNILYDNSLNSSISTQINFGTNSLATRNGLVSNILFDENGQGISIMYTGVSGSGIWRIINIGDGDIDMTTGKKITWIDDNQYISGTSTGITIESNDTLTVNADTNITLTASAGSITITPSSTTTINKARGTIAQGTTLTGLTPSVPVGESGSIIHIDTTSNIVLAALPSAVVGLHYTFVLSNVSNVNNSGIECATNGDDFNGFVNDGGPFTWTSINNNTLKFTSNALVGTWIQVSAITTGFWMVTGSSLTSASIAFSTV